MDFFERYEQLCLARGYKPVSKQAADAIGTSRGTVSAWKTSGSPPKTEFLIAIADVYHVSVDYLLCRTDDPTDHAHPGGRAVIAPEKVIESTSAQEATPKGVTLYSQLDAADRGKAEAFMQGLLAQDKYSLPVAGKKHA